MLQVQKFTFNPFQENTYILYNDLKEAVIIDPGCYTSAEKEELAAFIRDRELQPLALLSTHCHIDHVLGNAFIINTFNLDYYIHKEDLTTLNALERTAQMYGFPGAETSPEPTHYIEDGEELVFGTIRIKVIFGPGHAPGHVAFYSEKDQFVINGDILFKGSFGRYDLPGGNLDILKKTIFEKMFILPDNTLVYSGHGPETTIGEEKRSNAIYQY